MYRRILVPLDGTRFGDHALPYAVDIAARTGASIELVHVHHHREHNPDLAAMPQYQYQRISEADLRYDDASLDAERRWLEEKAADIELRHDVAVATRILVGRTDDAVLNEAQDIVADLIVMSSHARQGLPRLRLGDLAHELITQLNVPALCVRPENEDAPIAAHSIQRVLISLDGSDFSEQILDAVAPLLTQLGAQPTLLHIIANRPMLSTGFGDGRRSIGSRDQAITYLNDVAQRFRGRMPDPILAALEDPQPANVITSLLAAGEYDVVAMATHGRSGLSRLFMGSVAEEVLHSTHRPILMYRPRLERLPKPEFAEAFRIYGD
jgi:nucleotide-binding universal stress UspA family protein